MSAWDKSRLPSRHVTVGPERAPHRSYYYAMGMTEEEIAQPLVVAVGSVAFEDAVAKAMTNASCVCRNMAPASVSSDVPVSAIVPGSSPRTCWPCSTTT